VIILINVDELPCGYEFTEIENCVADFHALRAWATPDGVDAEDAEGMALPFAYNQVTGVASSGSNTSRPQLVGAAVTHAFKKYPVPGGFASVGGLAEVAVHPQHRRKGIMSALVARHFAECRRQGHVISVLGATEATVYGRFGYGIAAHSVLTNIPARVPLKDIPGAEDHDVSIESAEREIHGELVRSLHERYGAAPLGAAGINRPGWVGRETIEMDRAFWDDSPTARGGWEPLRIAVVRRDGDPRGYARFRRSARWNRMRPEGTVLLGEVVALDVSAARALWGSLLSLDLMTEVEPSPLVPDDHIFGLLADPRAIEGVLRDSIWARVLNVPEALTARKYSADIDIVFEVVDRMLPDNCGTWRLKAERFGAASCEKVIASPAFTFDIATLGAMFLGSTPVADLAQRGEIRVNDDSLLGDLAVGFSWPVPAGVSWPI